jgi:type IV secretion system protein VirB10
MSDADISPIEPSVEPADPKGGVIRLSAPRRPATKINRKFIVMAGSSTAIVLAVFFGARMAGAAAHQLHTKDPAATAPVAPPPNVKPPSYRDAVIAQADDGSTTVAMPCSQYPGYAACTPDASLPGAASGAGVAGQTGVQAANSPEATAEAQRRAAAEQQAYQSAQAARAAGVFFPGGSGGGAAGQASAAPAAQEGIIAASNIGPGATSSNVLADSGQDEKRAFAGVGQTDDYIQGRLEAPRSPYEVKAGTVIPAALVTAINSDLPGEIIAQVTQPVYDHVTGRFLLIPQGARLIGQYDSQVAWGQNRALISWTRIIFPNGYSVNIGAMEGADQSGASGLTDHVNHHWGTVAAGVLVSAILSVGTAAAEDSGNSAGGVTVINTGAASATDNASRVGDRIVNKALDRQPTIQVRAGHPLRVLVSKDIILEPYR